MDLVSCSQPPANTGENGWNHIVHADYLVSGGKLLAESLRIPCHLSASAAGTHWHRNRDEHRLELLCYVYNTLVGPPCINYSLLWGKFCALC